MNSKRSNEKPLFFENAEAFRAWLEVNAGKASELIVGFYKVSTGKPSITWPESVDEAICFGWIDGLRKRIDDSAYQIRFTPRNKNSTWSAINIAKVKKLSSEGRMKPNGLAAFERRTERNSGIYSYEQNGSMILTPQEEHQFKKNKQAWKFFESAPPGYRKIIIHWIASAKQQATRTRRFAKLIEASADGKKLFQ